MKSALETSTTEAIRLARADRAYLVPVIGAGVSIPLGLPNWADLIQRLLASSALPAEDLVLQDSATTLRQIKAHLGETTFIARIQAALRLSSFVTSTALQALVTAQISHLITTNLDYAIETAFTKVGSPLSREAIGCGYSLEELSLFDQQSKLPTLLKIHGSLERPSTWVLTADDYDKAYQRPGDLREFLVTKVPTPLFVGFSFSDFDLDQSLRLARLSWQRRAYAIVSKRASEQLRETFKSYGVIPIPFYSFNQVPEIIDDIFQCRHLTISWTHDNTSTGVRVRVGAAEMNIAQSVLDFSSKNEMLQHLSLTTIANAVEVQPNTSLLDEQPRRKYLTKGLYKTNILKMIQQQSKTEIGIVIEALCQYPETLFEGLIVPIMARTDLDDDDWFWFFGQLFEGIPDAQPEMKERLSALLLQDMHRSDLHYSCLRAIAKTLAQRGIHPALGLPPLTARVGRLLVPIYLLTENQVAALNGEPLLNSRSIRPYTLNSHSEANEIVSRLQEMTGQKWRLPTVSEWIEIAEISDGHSWPWGQDPPQYRVHAHLNYIQMKERVAQHTLEVGLFPQGQSSRGIFDLIGNVHEIVNSSSTPNFSLAGGAWSSRYAPSTRFRILSPLHRPKPNAGIRPVLDVDS